MSRILTRLPWLMVSSQAGGLMAAGDVISQTYVEKKNLKDIDIIRTLKFGAIGAFFVGPTLGWWYGVLERRIVLKTPALTALGKVVADQGFFAPIFLSVFIVINGATSFKSKAQIEHELKRDYMDILVTNYKVWPAVQVVNFYLIPLKLRVLFVQTVALFWNCYLSNKTHQ